MTSTLLPRHTRTAISPPASPQVQGEIAFSPLLKQRGDGKDGSGYDQETECGVGREGVAWRIDGGQSKRESAPIGAHCRVDASSGLYCIDEKVEVARLLPHLPK